MKKNKKTTKATTGQGNTDRSYYDVRALAGQLQTGIGVEIGDIVIAMFKKGELNEKGAGQVSYYCGGLIKRLSPVIRLEILKISRGCFGIVKTIPKVGSLEIGQTKGDETFCGIENYFCDSSECCQELKRINRLRSKPTNCGFATACELSKPGTCRQVFEGINQNLDSICFTRSQIVIFVSQHRESLLAEMRRGTSVLFLVKEQDEYRTINIWSTGGVKFSIDMSNDFNSSRGYYTTPKSRIWVIVPNNALLT